MYGLQQVRMVKDGRGVIKALIESERKPSRQCRLGESDSRRRVSRGYGLNK